MFSQFVGAEMIAEKYQFRREELDRFALDSHRKAARATEAGAFDDEIVALQVADEDGNETAPHDATRASATTPPSKASPRSSCSRRAAGSAPPTPARSATAPAGVLVVSEAALKAHGLTPLARIHNLTVTAGDPVIMLEEPIPATRRALERAGMSIDDIDLYEVNEAFAPVPLAWLREIGADPGRGSTSTAARSRSAIRSAPRAPS